MTTKKVSVCMITYNHAHYIEQAVRSALDQQGVAPLEIIIGEDASTDRTADVIRSIATAYPGQIQPRLHASNLGMMANFLDAYAACTGDFIAFLEGDDYWTNPQKLKLQIEALEAHPHWSGCFHPVIYVNQNGQPTGQVHPRHIASEVTFADLCRGNCIQTCSLVIRRDMLPALPDWVRTMPMGDWPLCLLAARCGPIGMLPEPMACYRLHSGGVWSTQAWLTRSLKLLDVYPQLAEHLPAECLPDLFAGQHHFARHLVDEMGEITQSLSHRLGFALTWPLRRLISRR
ncbi:glycosyltransferase [bacterium]|nr:glycosyltransferase [bacterium]